MNLTLTATLADLLPHDVESLGGAIRDHLGKSGLAVGLPFLERQASESLHTALSRINLCELLAQAWMGIAAVRAYRAPGKLAPGEIGFVQLGKHELGFTANPTLKLKIGEAPAPDLAFTYALKAVFDRATLSVRDGMLVGADPGGCDFTLTLSCGKVQLHDPWVLSRVDIPGSLNFVPGWKIP